MRENNMKMCSLEINSGHVQTQYVRERDGKCINSSWKIKNTLVRTFTARLLSFSQSISFLFVACRLSRTFGAIFFGFSASPFSLLASSFAHAVIWIWYAVCSQKKRPNRREWWEKRTQKMLAREREQKPNARICGVAQFRFFKKPKIIYYSVNFLILVLFVSAQPKTKREQRQNRERIFVVSPLSMGCQVIMLLLPLQLFIALSFFRRRLFFFPLSDLLQNLRYGLSFLLIFAPFLLLCFLFAECVDRTIIFAMNENALCSRTNSIQFYNFPMGRTHSVFRVYFCGCATWTTCTERFLTRLHLLSEFCRSSKSNFFLLRLSLGK